jgi:hypothetical protein
VLAQVSRAQTSAWDVLVPVDVASAASAWSIREQVEADWGSSWNVFYISDDVTLDVTGPTQRTLGGTLLQLSTVGTLADGKIINGTLTGATMTGSITQRSITGSGPTDR